MKKNRIGTNGWKSEKGWEGLEDLGGVDADEQDFGRDSNRKHTAEGIFGTLYLVFY